MTPEERRRLLAMMDLATTDDFLLLMGCSKATLRKMTDAGLQRFGIGRQRFVRLSEVAPLLQSMEGEP